jgi:hypothetical protein
MPFKIHILMITLLSALFIVQDASPAELSHRTKPQPPVQISIAPVQSGLSSSSIKPGDSVEFSVNVLSSTDASEMRVVNMLDGGTELIAGDLSWSGAVQKGQEVIVSFTVRAPLKGKGKITSQVEIFSGDVLLYSSKAVYELGAPEKSKPAPPRGVMKDSKGQDVIEYR